MSRSFRKISLAAMLLFGVLGPQLVAQEPNVESLRRGARLGDLGLVQAAIENKVDVNSQTEYGVTPLSLACDHGHEAVVRYLLDHGADPNIKDRFYRVGPMGWAISRKHTSVVALLVKAGCTDIDSSLAASVELANEELVKILMESEHLTKDGLQAAWKAAKDAKQAAILTLIEAKLPEADRPKDPEPTSPKIDLQKAQSLVGGYKSESGNRLTLSIKDNQVSLKSEESGQSLVLTELEADRYQSQGMEFQFVRESDKVTGMKAKIGEQEVLYQKLVDGAAPSEPAAAPVAPTSIRPDYPLDSIHWPGFRGTLARGVSEKANVATEWDGESNKNIAWKVPIDGLATSSPIAWGDRVYLTTAIRESDQRGFRVGAYGDVESENFDGECIYQVLCLDLATGKNLWTKESTRAVPKVKRHAKSSHANPTPVTDGSRVIASFGGEGVYAYSMDGELLWSLQLGMLDSGWFYDPTYQWGFGSSPFLFEDMVILQCDVQEGSFIVSVDATTGKERWRAKRNEIPTWSSPVAFMAPDGRPTVVVAGTKKSAAYDARTGEELWSLGGFSEIVVPTPQITPHTILLTSGYAPVQPIVALQHGASGELKMPPEKKADDKKTDDKKDTTPFLWNLKRGGPYMPTPIVYQERLFVVDNSGILSCYAMENGTRLFRKRIRSEEANAFTASPVIANGHLIAISEIGIAFVVSLKDDCKVVAENKLGEAVLASPAIAGNKLLIRGEKHLYAIEESAGL
jgi:outer membrane protein assembly factor BamB